MSDRGKKLLGNAAGRGDGFQKLEEIFANEVFELYIRQGKGYVPYMMNDALECYLILTECRCTGEYLPGYEQSTQGYLSCQEEEYVLVVHQGEDNIFTLWFRGIEVKTKLYQYHQIGHFWREEKGGEQWRQLVYMMGTVYDKYEYLGVAVCTPGEQELMRLMEFQPFRYWSPVKESLDEYYRDTARGAAEMKVLARLAGDRGMAFLAGIYERFPLIFLEKLIIGRMERPCSQRLYERIREEIIRESEKYGERDYGREMNEGIERERAETEARFRSQGFQGDYPRFWKRGIEVLAVEEHPFTIGFMEWEKFQFRIQYMVSRDVSGRNRKLGLNGGFFKGRGREGRILKNFFS